MERCSAWSPRANGRANVIASASYRRLMRATLEHSPLYWRFDAQQNQPGFAQLE